MRVVLACGDRNWDNQKKVDKILRKEHIKNPITYLIEGGQRTAYQGSWGEDSWKGYYGGDYQARVGAEKLGIQVIECPANWGFHHKAAGPIRNQMQLKLFKALAVEGGMISGAEQRINGFVLALHSDLKHSKGTKDMVNRAKKVGVKVKVIK